MEKIYRMVEEHIIKKWSIFLMLWFVVLQYACAAFEPDGFKLPFYTLLPITIGHLFISSFVAFLNRWNFVFQLWVAIALMDLIGAFVAYFYNGWDNYGWMATLATLLTLTLLKYGKSRFSNSFKAFAGWWKHNGSISRI